MRKFTPVVRQVFRIALFLLAVPCYAQVRATSASDPNTTADKILEAARARYSSLNSYADTGIVIYEFGTGSKERHTFTTYFSRAPRGFYFDFNKENGDRYVIWGDPEAFHAWWKTTGVKDDYPNPNNTGAFTGADVHSVGAAMKITPLLYSKAAMQGSFTNYTDSVGDGTEDVAGHRCYRLVGTARDIYGATGRESNVRKMTVWIDAESLLVRKVVEVPKDILPGHIDRVTTTYEPQANPTIGESRFKFTPPPAK